MISSFEAKYLICILYFATNSLVRVNATPLMIGLFSGANAMIMFGSLFGFEVLKQGSKNVLLLIVQVSPRNSS